MFELGLLPLNLVLLAADHDLLFLCSFNQQCRGATVIDTSGVFAVLIPSHELRHNGADADAARVRALIAYKDFLTLWKNADPDIPILRQAKAEYARLQ